MRSRSMVVAGCATRAHRSSLLASEPADATHRSRGVGSAATSPPTPRLLMRLRAVEEEGRSPRSRLRTVLAPRPGVYRDRAGSQRQVAGNNQGRSRAPRSAGPSASLRSCSSIWRNAAIATRGSPSGSWRGAAGTPPAWGNPGYLERATSLGVPDQCRSLTWRRDVRPPCPPNGDRDRRPMCRRQLHADTFFTDTRR
jgi:hypothetical protein